MDQTTMTLSKLRFPAFVCALSLLVCLWLVQPWLGMGTNDDPSYARSALLLAQTGHIVYNGWAAPILGWQLYLGALFIKLFGFSFDVLRLSTLLVAMVTAFVSQRAMVRFGLTEWNATLATLTLLLSPIFLPLTFSYMTDIGGLAVLVLCWYGSLRATQSEDDLRASCWIVFAAFTSAIGGTSRQTGWLGVFIIVPCALWLARKRSPVVVSGLAALAVSVVFILEVNRWFARQAHVVGTGGSPGVYDHGLIVLARSLGGSLFEVPLLILPVLIPFLPLLRLRNRRTQIALLGCILMSAIILAWIFTRPDPGAWLLPSGASYFTAHGAMDSSLIHGSRPVILKEPIRIVLTLLALAGASGCIVFWAQRYWPSHREQTDRSLRVLWTLLGPVFAVYLCLLIPRSYRGGMFDRYLLPILFVLLVVVVRSYQDTVRRALPRYSLLLILVAGAFSVALTHDAFSMLRAWLQTAESVRASGVPRNKIDAGFEYNLSTQLDQMGYIPADRPSYHVSGTYKGCRPELRKYIPVVRPQYALSFDPDACSGPSGFSPVSYREWIGPRNVSIYVVKTAPIPDGQ